jgi:hypothetical protein
MRNGMEQGHQSSNVDPPLTEIQQRLLRSSQDWLEKGRLLHYLYGCGVDGEAIFQATGLDPSEQEQLRIAADVYGSLEKGNAPRPVLSHYARDHGGILCEFQALTQMQRVHAATLAVAKHLNVGEAKEVASAIEDFSRFSHPPEGFSEHSGDAVAYRCWIHARRASDPAHREHLIARGLRFAHSTTARIQLETLLDQPARAEQASTPEEVPS